MEQTELPESLLFCHLSRQRLSRDSRNFCQSSGLASKQQAQKTCERRCWVRQMWEPQPTARTPTPRFSGAARHAFPRLPTSGCKSGQCSRRRRRRPRRCGRGGGGGDWKAGSPSLLRRGEPAGFPTAAEPPRRRRCDRATWDGERL